MTQTDHNIHHIYSNTGIYIYIFILHRLQVLRKWQTIMSTSLSNKVGDVRKMWVSSTCRGVLETSFDWVQQTRFTATNVSDVKSWRKCVKTVHWHISLNSSFRCL